MRARAKLISRRHCATCHSPAGDLAHIASKFDPVALQSRFLYPKTIGFAACLILEKKLQLRSSWRPARHILAPWTTGRLQCFDHRVIRTASDLFFGSARTSVEIKNPLKPHLDLLRQYTDDDDAQHPGLSGDTQVETAYSGFAMM